MAKVVIYTIAGCPFCNRAKAMLQEKGVSYIELRVDESLNLRHEMEEKSGRYTVPQIFIDEEHIGGYDNLSALDEEGKLEALLNKDQ